MTVERRQRIRVRRVDLVQGLPTAINARRIAIGQRDPRFPGQQLDRFGKTDGLPLHDEAEQISAHSAPEAMEQLFGRAHGEGRA